MKKKLSAVLLTSSLVFSTSCGLLLYPERQGQTGGKLDPKVVALDILGLVFFLVPGIVAFAVDYSSGTIYLPNTSASVDTEKLKSPEYLNENFDQIIIQGEVTQQKIESAIEQRFNQAIDLEEKSVVAIKVEGASRGELSILNAGLRSTAVY